jgi:hypothetical protein
MERAQSRPGTPPLPAEAGRPGRLWDPADDVLRFPPMPPEPDSEHRGAWTADYDEVE